MLRRIVRISLIAIPVALLLIYLLRDRSPFGRSNTSFAVKKEKEITKIIFSDIKSTLRLEKRGEEWVVNGRNDTRKSSIYFILKILKEMEIKSPVSPELFRKEIDEKGITPVKVRVYSGRRIIRTFYVYKTSSNPYGNYMKIRESSKPYIVSVPGSEAGIGPAFTLNELFWRTYTVFNLLPSEINSVTVENFADTASSFRIKNEKGKLELSDMSANLTGWDTSRMKRYISYFTGIQFETWAFDMTVSEQEAVKKNEPLYRITVLSTAGEKRILTLWERSVEEKDGTIKKDTDRLWGRSDGSETIFIIKYTDIDPVLKKLSYFFPG